MSISKITKQPGEGNGKVPSVRPAAMAGKKPEPERQSSNEQIVSFPHYMSQPPKKETEAWLVVIEHFADIRRGEMNGTKADIYGAGEVLEALGKLTPAEKKQIRRYIEKLASISPYDEVRKAAGAVTY